LGGEKLQSIQMLRGLAALSVVMLHVLQRAEKPYASPIGDAVTPWIAPYGLFAVDVFFVISGFIIAALITKSQESQRETLFGPDRSLEKAFLFLVRRALRIYPAFWASLVATFLFIWLGGWVGFSHI
jgi:peptidoglycan/LPS O-acetylase OafA/YrhL